MRDILSALDFYDQFDEMLCYFDHNPAQAIPEEMLFRLVNYRLTHLNVDSVRFVNHIARLKSEARADKPAASMINEYYQNLIHDDAYALRFASLSASELDALTFKEMDALCKDYMSNYNGAVFLIEGDISEGKMLDLAAKYFGNLPSKPEPVAIRDIQALRLRSCNDSAIHRFSAPKPRTDLLSVYAQENGFDCNASTAAYLEMLTKIADRIMDENIRFKDGGLYSVGCFHALLKQPNPQIRINIQTTCDPENRDYIMGKINELIGEMANGDLISEQAVNDCKVLLLENVGRDYFGKSDNLFRSYYLNGETSYDFTKDDVESITPEKLRQFLRDLISNGKHFELMLVGE